MGAVTWKVEADFDRNGSWETDLTSYVELPGQGVSISRGIGRDNQNQITKLTIALSNRTGHFSPRNSASPFYGKLDIGIPIRLVATHNAVDYTLATAYSTKWKTKWQWKKVSLCQLECADIIWFLREGDPINLTVDETRTVGDACTAIAAAIGLTAGDYDFDAGRDLPIHFAVGENPLEAFRQAVASEMGGYLYPKATGELRFEASGARLGTTVDDTWGDSTSIKPQGIEYDDDAMEYFTSVDVRATIFRTGAAGTPIFEFSQNMFTKPAATSMALATGEIWERTFNAKSAYVALSTAVAITDYLANSAIDGSGTDRTANLTVTVTDLGGGRFRLRLQNTHASTIYVTKLQIRGEPVEFFADRPEVYFSLAVPNLKAGKSLSFEVPFAPNSNKVRDYGYQELRVGRYGWAPLRLTFLCDTDAKREAMLAADLGQLVAYRDDGFEAHESPGVNDWWYIEGLSYHIPPNMRGNLFACTVTLVPSYVYRNLDAIVFDTFERADATGDLGTAFSGGVWANDTGFNIVSNVARANTDTLSIPDVSVGSANMVVEVSLAAIGAGDEVGVHFGWVDASNYYRVYLDKGSNEVILEKVVAGVVTELASPAFTVGTSHELQVLRQSNRIRATVDRVNYIDTTDSALTTGTRAGLMARNANATTTFDNFYAQGL